MTLNVALVGRPNVGKSTLFNRLTGEKLALVADVPGVTRDRREGEGRIGPLTFRLVDTAGLEEAESGSLAHRMTAQTLQAVEEADVVVMIVDGRSGLTPTDRYFADVLRRSKKPIVLVVNKAESMAAAQATIAEAYGFGLGDPIPVSAEHGEGLADLYEALSELQVASGKLQAEETDLQLTTRNLQLTIAIIGRPNAGKSTLINRLLGEDRLLAGPEAGITRDAIMLPFTYDGRDVQLVDTAGMRRRAKVKDTLEQMSVGDTLRAIRRASVIVVLMDATLAFEKQDLQLAELAAKEGRAVVLGISKWDMVPLKDRDAYLETAQERVEETLPQLRGVPVIPLSATRGSGLPELMKAIFRMEKAWNMKIPTAKLNRWLEEALERHAPPIMDGRRLKVRYMTQTKTRPPTFALFANLKQMPDHYQRYLVNSLRDVFHLRGVPIRLQVRTGKNPYA